MLFQYTQLSPNTIRLVHFDPLSTPSDIHLTITHQENYWESSRHYSVLTYDHDSFSSNDIKGPSQEPSPTKPITLHGRTRLIPTTLWDALSAMIESYRFRSGVYGNTIDKTHQHHEPHAQLGRWWIDMLSVNQRDQDEIRQQNGIQKTIYDSADRVVVWCGRAFDGVERLFELSRRFEKEETKEAEESSDLKHRTGYGSARMNDQTSMNDGAGDEISRDVKAAEASSFRELEHRARYCLDMSSPEGIMTTKSPIELMCGMYRCELQAFRICRDKMIAPAAEEEKEEEEEEEEAKGRYVKLERAAVL